MCVVGGERRAEGNGVLGRKWGEGRGYLSGCAYRGVGGMGVRWSRAVGLGGCVSTDALWPGVTTRARKLNPTINHRAPPLVIKRALAMMYEPCHNYWLTLAACAHTHTYCTRSWSCARMHSHMYEDEYTHTHTAHWATSGGSLGLWLSSKGPLGQTSKTQT